MKRWTWLLFGSLVGFSLPSTAVRSLPVSVEPLAAGPNDSQLVKVVWESSRVAVPNTIRWYFLEYWRNGREITPPVYGISNGRWIPAWYTDSTGRYSLLFKMPPPNPGKRADYRFSIQAIAANGLRGHKQQYIWRRVNTSQTLVALDSVTPSLRVTLPGASRVLMLGDSFRLYRRAFVDTATIGGPFVYEGTVFTVSKNFTLRKVRRTDRYGYYVVIYRFGRAQDTIPLAKIQMEHS